MIAGNIQVKKGYWYILLNLKDETGKRKIKWIATHLKEKGNKKRAEEMLIEYRQKYTTTEAIIANSRGVFFHEYMQAWINGMKGKVAPTTYSSYTLCVQNTICPYFKKHPVLLTQMKPTHINAYYDFAPDGSTRVSIYYDRVSYPLTFAYGTGGSEVTVSTPYGATIVKPSNPSKQGYLFSGWNPAAIPDTMPANPLTFTAQWAEKTDTPYTVKHYKQNLDGTYALEQTEGKFGTTGETTAAEARTYTGFTAQTITQKSIAPDGRTVVEIQYARNSHMRLVQYVKKGV